MKLLTLFIFVLFSIQAVAQTDRKAEREARKQADYSRMKEIVSGREFQFIADHALPSSGSSISLFSNPNHLTIRGDSVYCDMPFFGRAYRVNYNFEGGFHFKGLITDYNIEEKKKKNTLLIRFKTKDEFDSYLFMLTLTGPESASLSINSNNRASISYWGKANRNPSEE